MRKRLADFIEKGQLIVEASILDRIFIYCEPLVRSKLFGTPHPWLGWPGYL